MPLPRMRTIAAAYAEIKAMDEHTAITQNQIRNLVKSGAIKSVPVGSHSLINLDLLIDYFASTAYQNCEDAEKPQQAYGKLRQVAE